MTKARYLADNSAGNKPKIVDAKGDLLVGNTDDSVIRVPLGNNTQILTVDSSTTSGVKWAVAPESGFNQFLLMGA